MVHCVRTRSVFLSSGFLFKVFDAQSYRARSPVNGRAVPPYMVRVTRLLVRPVLLFRVT